MVSRLFYRSIALIAIGGSLAIGHSLIPLKYPIILGAPKAPTPIVVPQSDGSNAGRSTPVETNIPDVPASGPGLDITIPEAVAFFNQGAPFLDARHLEEYTAGHVQNAFYLTADLLIEGKGQEVLSMLDPQSTVVVYCGGGMCDASKNLVNYLQAAGFTRCHIMHDGYPAWSAANHPTATGAPEVGQ
jgi:rhodanese-related sulfurtransferase